MDIEKFRLTDDAAKHIGLIYGTKGVAESQLEAIRPSYVRLVEALNGCVVALQDRLFMLSPDGVSAFREAEAALKEVQGQEGEEQ